jgi:hypothetical protein
VRASAGRAEQAAHHVQSFSNSCQPACLAMALGRRGVEPIAAIEARLHIGADPAGHPADERKWLSEPRTSLLRSTIDAVELRRLREVVARGAWVMVHVFGPRWVARLPRGLLGPHGPLCQASDTARPLHAVLLVAFGPACFFILDPFHTRDLQPLEVSDAELLSVLAGFSSLVIEC